MRRCAILHNAVLLPKGLHVEVVGIAVLHLGDDVKVTEAGVILG
jgi:hypothetical protein